MTPTKMRRKEPLGRPIYGRSPVPKLVDKDGKPPASPCRPQLGARPRATGKSRRRKAGRTHYYVGAGALQSRIRIGTGIDGTALLSSLGRRVARPRPWWLESFPL